MPGKLISEGPTETEKRDLPTHVDMCHMRYMNIADAIQRVTRLQWAVILILLAGTISNSLTLWLK